MLAYLPGLNLTVMPHKLSGEAHSLGRLYLAFLPKCFGARHSLSAASVTATTPLRAAATASSTSTVSQAFARSGALGSHPPILLGSAAPAPGVPQRRADTKVAEVHVQQERKALATAQQQLGPAR